MCADEQLVLLAIIFLDLFNNNALIGARFQPYIKRIYQFVLPKFLVQTTIDQDAADIGRIIDVNAQHLESNETGRSGKLDGVVGVLAELAPKALANDNTLTSGHFAQRFLAVSSGSRQTAHASGFHR